MLKRMNLTDLFKAVKTQIQDKTGMKCYDAVPDNAPSPFYYMELSGNSPADTKTMFVQRYSVDIHVIAEPTPSSVPTYKYIQMLEESLTEDIKIPCEFILVRQDETGIKTIYSEETGEKHSVVGFDFLVAYGYKFKI